MATITRRDLIDLAATNLGVLAAGQVLADEDLDFIDARCTALFDQLSEDEIVTLVGSDEIPASMSDYLAALLSNLVAPNYGGPFSPDTKILNEAILRKLTRSKNTFEPVQTDYF